MMYIYDCLMRVNWKKVGVVMAWAFALSVVAAVVLLVIGVIELPGWLEPLEGGRGPTHANQHNDDHRLRQVPNPFEWDYDAKKIPVFMPQHGSMTQYMTTLNPSFS